MENKYTTHQGEAISNLLRSQSGRHFTADEILKSLEADGIHVGKATVYRHLEKLIKVGKVRKYTVDGASACYEYSEENHDCELHYHLKCSECGQLIHTQCSYLDKMAEHVNEHHGFVVSPEKTVLYGICKDCRAKNEA